MEGETGRVATEKGWNDTLFCTVRTVQTTHVRPMTHLMGVKGDSLKIGNQVSFGGGIWALVGDVACYFVQLVT